MTKEDITVFVRIALYVVIGRLAAGGWLPQDIADIVAMDPDLIEALTTLVIAIGVGVWYWFSDARKSLRLFYWWKKDASTN